MSSRKSQKGCLESSVCVLVPVAAFRLPVPWKLTRCYRCGQPAVYIECVVFEDEQLQDKIYDDAELNAFVENLRLLTDTNFELPVCQRHSAEGVV